MHLVFPKAHIFNVREIGTKSEKHKYNVDDLMLNLEM